MRPRDPIPDALRPLRGAASWGELHVGDDAPVEVFVRRPSPQRIERGEDRVHVRLDDGNLEVGLGHETTVQAPDGDLLGQRSTQRGMHASA